MIKDAANNTGDNMKKWVIEKREITSPCSLAISLENYEIDRWVFIEPSLPKSDWRIKNSVEISLNKYMWTNANSLNREGMCF